MVHNVSSMTEILQSISFPQMQENFDLQLKHQAKFLRNFMTMFEKLLLFIRATRRGLWHLHLQSLHEMSSYFFAFDLQNYSRLTPVYLSQMCELQISDPQTWSFLQRNFVVNKTHIPFSAIGTDHAIEHENRVMKVIGGIKGIANQSSALEKHFLVASDMNKVIGEFQDTLGIGYQSRQEHYQFTGDTNARIARNVKNYQKSLQLMMSTFTKKTAFSTLLQKLSFQKICPHSF